MRQNKIENFGSFHSHGYRNWHNLAEGRKERRKERREESRRSFRGKERGKGRRKEREWKRVRKGSGKEEEL